MTATDQLRDLLPSLYRPDEGDGTLTEQLITAFGFVLDGASIHVQNVLRAHWFDSADSALFDAHYQTDRAARNLAAANVRAPRDVKELLAYPHIDDLGRIGALLNLAPWLEPLGWRESVEEYRQRLADLLAAYRSGMTTLPALVRVLEAALPEDLTRPIWAQRWPFAIEEPCAVARTELEVVVPDGVGPSVGPLTRFRLSDIAGAPVCHFENAGSEPVRGPLLERVTKGQVPLSVGVAYRGELAPGQALRLSPARQSWLVLEGALAASAAETIANADADVAQNGPWTGIAGAPAGTLRLLVQAADHALWLSYEAAGSHTLVRYDGTTFQAIASDPSLEITALAARGRALYVASTTGLWRCDLFPTEGDDYALAAVSAAPEALSALALLPGGLLACAGEDGVVTLNDADEADERLLPGVAVRALGRVREQLFVATAQALLLADAGRWYRYEGADLDETRPDWVPIEPVEAAAATSPLPSVLCLNGSADGSLWLGTDHGLARYRVAGEQTTLLEAYPDLGDGAVRALALDDRGELWVGSDDGLFRFDGRELRQYLFDRASWTTLGRADSAYPDELRSEARGHFRYASGDAAWQRFDARSGRFAAPSLPVRSEPSPAASALSFAPSLRAELGSFAEGEFTPTSSLPLSDFVMRLKPDQTRIVTGGLPALPRCDSGPATLRYLELEPEDMVVPEGRPWWSREGRLFLPPEADLPLPGRYRDNPNAYRADGEFDATIFAYPASIRLYLAYPVLPRLGVRVRLGNPKPGQSLEPLLVNRVWQLLLRTKPAGVPFELCFEGQLLASSSDRAPSFLPNSTIIQGS